MIGFKNFINIDYGDHVLIKYKDSKYFLKTGKVTSVRRTGSFAGDCTVQLDFTGEIVDFYYTNLLKIVEIVEDETGEIFKVTFPDFNYLSDSELLKYDTRGFYIFKKDDKTVKSLTI